MVTHAEPIHSILADDEVIGPLLSEFVRDLVETAEKIEAAGRRGDRATARNLCHRLCGTAATFGFPELSAVAAVGERVAQDPAADARALAVAAAAVLDVAERIAVPDTLPADSLLT